MICKYCGMESTTSDRCSYCGQVLAAAPEPAAPVTPAQEPAERASAPAPEPVRTEAPAPTPEPVRLEAPAVAPEPVRLEAPNRPAAAPLLSGPEPGAPAAVGKPPLAGPTAPRKPAPAILPKASERAGRLPAPAEPLPDGRSAPSLSFDPTKLEPNQPHVSLADPLAEHTLYMQNAARPPQAPLLDADLQAAAPPAPDPVADAARLAAAGVKPMPPLPDKKPVKKHTPPPDVVAAGTPTALLGRYTIALLLILLVAAALTYVGPAFQGIPLVVAQFVGGMLLPVMRLVPWADEDSDDLVLFILLTIMFGPLVSLLIYAVLGMVRGTVNAGLLGCMVVAALTRLDVQLAAHDTPITQVISQTMPFSHLAAKFDGHLLVLLLKDWSGLVALVGWYFATMFRKLDE